MNLELDTDQRDLVAATTEVCAALTGGWRTGSDSGQGTDLKTLAQVGILGARHPEPAGSGLGPVEAVLVARECGAALAPAPLLIWADLIGPAVPGVLSGEVSVTGTFDAERGVSFGGATDVVVLAGDDGAYKLDAGSVDWQQLASPDPTVSRARPHGVGNRELIADPDAVQAWRWQSRLLSAAHLTGIGRAAVESGVAHARQRQQFGRMIGSFQAVKHLLADAYTAVELASSQVLVASVCWAEGDPRAADQALAAALLAGRAAVAAAETAIQVHGGMGFTWEADPHLYYKRALLLTDEFGGVGLARELIGRDLVLSGSSSGAEQR